MRQVAAAVALALSLSTAWLAATTIPASADDQIPLEQAWGGSRVDPVDPVTTPTSELRIRGRIQNGAGRQDSVAYARPTVTVTLGADEQTRCASGPDYPAVEADLGTPELGGGPTSSWKAYSYTADLPFPADRNGPRTVYVCINGNPRLDTTVMVLLPAPTVTNLLASSDGDQVTVAWDDMRVAAPDLAGYRIERSVGGEFEALAEVGPEVTTYTDTMLPAEGGEASYRAISMRPHVADAAPSDSSLATFAAAAPGNPAGGGPGGAAGGPATGGPGPGTTGAAGGAGGQPGGEPGPAIQIPRVGTPSRNFFPALLAPPADTGFSETLPYEDPSGEALGEELASEPLDEALPGRGLVIPIATALVLAMWAMHMRFLARAARPAYEDPIEIFLEP